MEFYSYSLQFKVPTVHVISTMPPPKKSKPAESEGEDFGDVDDTNFDSSEEEVAREVIVVGNDTLTFVCPTFGPCAKREDFEEVGGQV